MKLVRSLLLGSFCALALCLPACSSPFPGGHPCLPEPLQINPREVPAGSSVTVSSGPFQCGGSYPAGKTYRLTLGLAGRSTAIELGSYPVKTDGSFRATTLIPANASPGVADIVAFGSPYDQCDDSRHGSCASYVVDLKIVPSTIPLPLQAPA
jgi:hypothetical protein